MTSFAQRYHGRCPARWEVRDKARSCRVAPARRVCNAIQTRRTWRSNNAPMSTMPDKPARPSAKGDERWERCVAMAEAHDADARQRAQVLGILVLSTVAVALAVTLGLN